MKTSIAITTNRGVESWGEILGDNTLAAALLDRLLHRSMVINLDGDSYRLRDHQATADNLRPDTTGNREPLQSTPLTGGEFRRAQVGNFGERGHRRPTPVLATLRNTATSLLRRTGHSNITAGLRHHHRDFPRPVELLLTC